ncbi:MAG: hypothetical protein GXP25_17725 [Planctomycetes bacterium]|nr:hypothetical protein [Planctomycetota bacterium]
MRRMRFTLALAAFLVGAAVVRSDEITDMRRPKKLIATGWDKPDTVRLLQNLEEMEKRPFDGVVIICMGEIDAKKRCSMRGAFKNEAWKREWFQPCVDRMKACKFKRFTDNFVTVGANPGNVDWFDDDGWKQIVEHWRIAAWVAKQGGFKGILFDPEPYHKPYAQFRYSAQAGKDKHTFNEYYTKARERGRQVMEAIVSEYPDMTLFCYFMDIICSTATGEKDPRPMLERLGYGLLPPFADGWLDVMPPTVTLVDGCERAYMFNSAMQYLESALMIKGACQELVSPENRAKYRAQVQVSFGIYLDAYSNPEGSKYYMKTKLPSRLHQLRANVGTALRVADEYVWIYGEKYRWWPTPNKRVNEQSWAEAMPGSEKALFFARDPVEYGRKQIEERRKAGKLANLTRNGDFGSDKAPAGPGGVQEDWKEGGCPAGWHSWQVKESKGTFTWDREAGAAGKGSARAANVRNGCFIQSYEVKPGERYAVQAVRKIQGKGDVRIRVRWQTPDGRWTLETQDRLILAAGPRDQWAEMFGVVEIPETVGKLVLLLGVSDQESAEDMVWYDDVRVYKLE